MNKLAALLLVLALALLGGAQAAPSSCCMDCDNAVLCAVPGCSHCVSPGLPCGALRLSLPDAPPAAEEAPAEPASLQGVEIWKPPRMWGPSLRPLRF